MHKRAVALSVLTVDPLQPDWWSVLAPATTSRYDRIHRRWHSSANRRKA